MNKWTVMVYISAENDLDQESIWAIGEMYRAGIGKGVTVVAQIDTGFEGFRRFVLTEGTKQLDVDGDLFTRAKEIPFVKPSSARPRRPLSTYDTAASSYQLIAFLSDCMKEYHDSRYMLILAGHGSAATGNRFLWDEDLSRYFSLPHLKWAIDEVMRPLGRKIDILGMDSCAMNTAEVGFLLGGCVDYLIASEGFVMNTGWPYYRILQMLNGKTAADPRDVADEIVRRFVYYYADYAQAGISADMAACNLNQGGSPDALKDAVKTLVEQIQLNLNPAFVDAIIAAHWRAQAYMLDEYVDLWDFCDLLETSCQESMKTACRQVKEVIDNKYVVRSCYTGADYQHSHGVSIYFPWAANDEDTKRYEKSAFSRETGWGTFVRQFVKKTRREPRNDGGALEDIKIPPVYSSERNLRYNPPWSRFNPPWSKFNPPWSKGTIEASSKIKNPPLSFFKDTCKDTSKK